MIQQLVFMALILSIVLPFGAYLLGEKKKSRFKTSLAVNIISFFAILLIGTVAVFTSTASAETASVGTDAAAFAYIAAALSTGMSSIGAGIAVSSSASAALGALSENEGIMGKAMIFVALAEGVALYGLLMSFMILNRV